MNNLKVQGCPLCGKDLILNMGGMWISVDIEMWNNNTRDVPTKMHLDKCGKPIDNCNMCGKPKHLKQK